MLLNVCTTCAAHPPKAVQWVTPRPTTATGLATPPVSRRKHADDSKKQWVSIDNRCPNAGGRRHQAQLQPRPSLALATRRPPSKRSPHIRDDGNSPVRREPARSRRCGGDCGAASPLPTPLPPTLVARRLPYAFAIVWAPAGTRFPPLPRPLRPRVHLACSVKLSHRA